MNDPYAAHEIDLFEDLYAMVDRLRLQIGGIRDKLTMVLTRPGETGCQTQTGLSTHETPLQAGIAHLHNELCYLSAQLKDIDMRIAVYPASFKPSKLHEVCNMPGDIRPIQAASAGNNYIPR